MRMGLARCENQPAKPRLVQAHRHSRPCLLALQEVAIMRKVRHKNIVQFIGACTQKPNLCIVFEFMSGGSVYDYIRKVGAWGRPAPLAARLPRSHSLPMRRVGGVRAGRAATGVLQHRPKTVVCPPQCSWLRRAPLPLAPAGGPAARGHSAQDRGGGVPRHGLPAQAEDRAQRPQGAAVGAGCCKLANSMWRRWAQFCWPAWCPAARCLACCVCPSACPLFAAARRPCRPPTCCWMRRGR